MKINSKAFLASVFSVLILSNTFSPVSVNAEDEPPVDFIYDWGKYSYSYVEGYVLSNYTSLGQAGWAVSAMKLGVTEAYRNISWAYEQFYGTHQVSYNSISGTQIYVGHFVDHAGALHLSTVTASAKHSSFESDLCEYRQFSPNGALNFPSGRLWFNVINPPHYFSYNAPTARTPFSVSLVPYVTTSVLGNPSYSISFDNKGTPLFQDTLIDYTFVERPVLPNYPNGGYVNPAPFNVQKLNQQVNLDDLGVTDWNNPQNAVDAIKAWTETNYPDYVDEAPLPDYNAGGFPGFDFPPDFPLVIFPEVQVPTNEVPTQALSGLSFWFTTFTSFIEKLNLQWVSVFLFVLGLFFHILYKF